MQQDTCTAKLISLMTQRVNTVLTLPDQTIPLLKTYNNLPLIWLKNSKVAEICMNARII